MIPTRMESMDRLLGWLKQAEGAPYGDYGRLGHRTFYYNKFTVCFRHIQGSTGALPASVGRIEINITDLGLPVHALANSQRRLAAADYLLRAFSEAVAARTRRNRGAKGSGSFQPQILPPQVLCRNVVRLDATRAEINFRISLPGSAGNRILGREACGMLGEEVPALIDDLKKSVADAPRLKKHCDTVEDFFFLQERLEENGLMAFIADDAIPPRESGLSQRPMHKGAVKFKAPAELAVTVDLPNAGKVRGAAVRPGVTVLIGSGFHGKSTLLNALAKCVYPHIPGDGREQVVTHAQALLIRAEEGRCVSGVDIASFLPELPGDTDPHRFHTQNASGSTSQAAAVVEALLAGAKFLLLDEDTSATNFLIRDHTMRRLIPEDRSTPFYDRVREIHARFGVSTLLVVGSSSEYLGVAHQVVAMRKYQPVCMEAAVAKLSLPEPLTPNSPLVLAETRRLNPACFPPSYRASRLGKTIPVRIKPLRLQENILEYGDERLDLRQLAALADPDQVTAIGYALLAAHRRFAHQRLAPARLAADICKWLDEKGLDQLCPKEEDALFLAMPRPLELAGAIDRYRKLIIEVS